ncbi:MAG: hypothetical protein LBS54_00855 [Dysgonamonadaceae bacterium]|jgi:hypothetical protein|nr:hypothetical protein [Dysgonamonadaceae bacterium]
MMIRTIGYLYKQFGYNLKIVFAGKFAWFMIAALAVFLFIIFEIAWNHQDVTEYSVIYMFMLFPSILLIFYPTVFGIQNDRDSRILELIFGIPDYRYKVWGLRLAMFFVVVHLITVLFIILAGILLAPVPVYRIALQLLFPILFYGNFAFMFSAITRSGNGTATLFIIFALLPLFFGNMIENTMWDPYLNPFKNPDGMHPVIWASTILKNRLFLSISAVIFLMTGLLKLQDREKFL